MTNVDHATRVHRRIGQLLDLVSPPAPPPPGGFIDNLPEAFGALDENGEVFVIGYKGEWFVPVQPSLRVRIHNLIINAYNRKVEHDDARTR